MAALEDLLIVQEHDIAVDRLGHRREALPEQARLSEVEKTVAEVDGSLAGLRPQRDEVARREQRHEDELGSVESKIADVDRKLYSGTVTAPRELQAMQADVASLKRHRSDVEDQVLLAMQDREPLDIEIGRLEGQRASLETEAEALQKAIGEAMAAIDAELAKELRGSDGSGRRHPRRASLPVRGAAQQAGRRRRRPPGQRPMQRVPSDAARHRARPHPPPRCRHRRVLRPVRAHPRPLRKARPQMSIAC